MSAQHTVVAHPPPLREQIAATLRNAIVTLEFKPGQVLIERKLCELTGASRSSVREALRRLEADGLVESRNGRGTIVRAPDVHEVRCLYEVRAQLEGLAARLFCQRADDDQCSHLVAASMALARDVTGGATNPEILSSQADFYTALFDGAGNPVLDKMAHGLRARVAQLRALTLAVPGRAEESLAEFERIVDAITRRDAVAAEALAVAHVTRAGEVMDEIVLARSA